MSAANVGSAACRMRSRAGRLKSGVAPAAALAQSMAMAAAIWKKISHRSEHPRAGRADVGPQGEPWGQGRVSEAAGRPATEHVLRLLPGCREEALDQGKLFWFRIWRIDPDDRLANVVRVELRTKKELRNRWGIHTIQDVQASIADVFLSMVEEVRYRAPDQSDSNVWRQQLHPLWLAVVQHLEGSLLDFRSGLLPSDITELERQVAQERYRTMVLGNLAGYGVACGLDDASMERNLPEIARSLTVRALHDPERRFARSVDRAFRKRPPRARRVRLRFRFRSAGPLSLGLTEPRKRRSAGAGGGPPKPQPE
jgi:hypothetical protein